MGTLPIALPGCRESATTRIEVYSVGSLDASAYTCVDHVEAATAAIEAAGFIAYPAPMAPTVDRPCGYVHAFLTGRLADPSHPAWCDRADCRTRGRHRSLPLPVGTGRPEAVIADVALTQALGAGMEPMLALTVLDGDCGREALLSLGQAGVRSYRVRRLIDVHRRCAGNGRALR